MNAAEVTKRVQDALRGHERTKRVRVLPDVHPVSGDEDSDDAGPCSDWYVPVSVHRDEQWMSEIYETLSKVEEQLMESGLSVVLVPNIIPFVPWGSRDDIY